MLAYKEHMRGRKRAYVAASATRSSHGIAHGVGGVSVEAMAKLITEVLIGGAMTCQRAICFAYDQDIRDLLQGGGVVVDVPVKRTTAAQGQHMLS